MSEYAGPIVRIALSRSLWLIVLLPLIGAAMSMVLAWRRATSRAASRVAMATSIATLVVVVAHAVLLALAPVSERYLFEHLWRLVRVGQLDVNVDLAFDPLSAVACAIVSGGGLVAIYAARSESPARVACRCVVAAAALLVVVGDGFVVAIVAAEIATIACAALVTDGRRPRAILSALAADAPIVVGAAFLFWGLGGGWIGGGYTPDLAPRFVAVHDSVSPEVARAAAKPRSSRDDDDDDDDDRIHLAPGDGLLTLTSVPGAIVFVDDARTPLLLGDRALRAPFVRYPIHGGLHTFRVHAGGGTDDYVVPRVLVDGGREIALTMLGPTTTFRTMQDELVVRADRGGASTREALGERTLGGVRVVTLACVLLFVGLAARALSSASTAIVAALFFARLSFLFPMTHPASSVVAGGAIVFAFIVAASAWREPDGRRVVERVGIAHAAIAMAALALGAPTSAIALLIVVAFALAALRLTTTNARANLFASAALAMAPMPLLGAAWPAGAILASAYSSRAIAPLSGVIPYVGITIALAASSFATWRRHAAIEAISTRTTTESPRVAIVLAITALAVGPALVASPRLFGDRGESLLDAWLDPVLAPARARFAGVSVGTDAALFLVAFGASLAAWALARRSGAVVAKRDASTDIGIDRAIASVVLRVAALAASLDRWVIDSVVHAVGGAVGVLAWTTARADEELADAPVNIVATRASRSLAPLRRLAELQTWIYALLLGAFTAVVLYSLLSAA